MNARELRTFPKRIKYDKITIYVTNPNKKNISHSKYVPHLISWIFNVSIRPISFSSTDSAISYVICYLFFGPQYDWYYCIATRYFWNRSGDLKPWAVEKTKLKPLFFRNVKKYMGFSDPKFPLHFFMIQNWMSSVYFRMKFWIFFRVEFGNLWNFFMHQMIGNLLKI